MSQIKGSVGRSSSSPVQLRDRQESAASVCISLNDESFDASWRLQIGAQLKEGGWSVLDSVDTIPPNRSRSRSPNRVVAYATLPGATNWQVIATLLAGTPNPARVGSTTVFADLSISTSPEFGGGCCAVVPVGGNAIPSNVTTGGNQTPTGAPPIGTSILLYAGSGTALAADVAYLGAGAAFVQIHDLGVSTVGPTTASMLGIGYPVDVAVGPLAPTLPLQWPEGRRFSNGFTVALSTTQNTFTASAETISAFGRWDTP